MSRKNPLAEKELVYHPAGTESVSVQKDEPYTGSSGEVLSFDVYYRPVPAVSPLPVVFIAAGYPDPGFERFMGCRFKDMAANVSWARAIATTGLAAVTYTNREPTVDLGRVVTHVRERSDRYGLDPDRVALFATSGNSPVALAFGAEEARPWLKCISISYGYVLDRPGSTAVADVASKFGFAVPVQLEARAFRTDLPHLFVRGGRDEMPSLNAALDEFVGEALVANLPLTVANYPAAPHAFDILDDGPAARSAIELVLAFLRIHLRE